MGDLTDLEVERVDGVDRPATRRRFLITKAEGDGAAAGGAAGGGDELANAKRALAAAAKALGAVHAAKSEFDPETADALNAIMADAGVETRFTKAAPVAAASGSAALEGDALVAAIAKAVGTEVRKALDDAVPTDDETIVGQGEPVELAAAAATPPPASAQPAATTPIAKGERTAIRKNGEGMFGNLVFGPNPR